MPRPNSPTAHSTTKEQKSMPQAPYLPATDSAFDAWLTNFSALITAAPTTYGLIAGDATAIAAQQTAWNAAFLAATTPATRTPVTIADKDAARITAEATVRPYATTISRNPSVTNMDKIAVGVNLPNNARTPVPPPTTQPALTLVSAIHNVHTLAYRDTSTPTSKAKPFGAIGIDVRQAIGTTPATDPNACAPLTQATKSPITLGTDSADVGKLATYFGRWITRSGPGGQAQFGPWSASLVVAIV